IVRHACKEDQLMWIASIERHLGDLLVGDYLSKRGRPRFHQRGVRFNLHLLCSLANLKGDVDEWAGIDLKDNAGLHIRLEAGQTSLKHIRSKRQTRKDVVSSFIRDRRSLRAGRGLSYGNLDARQNGAALIFDITNDLSSGRLCKRACARQR